MASGRGRLGVRVESLNSEMSEALGAEGDHGVLVVQVMEDSPAQKAGLRAGDIIVKVEDRTVDSPADLVQVLSEQEGSVGLVVERKGVRKDLSADLDPGPGRSSRTYRADGDDGDVRVRVTPRIRTFRGNPEPGQGAKVYRWNTKDGDGDSAELREEIRQLKEELRELREQLREKR
jgi:membrane-associated protease RseP (regulator of RpoE activity)